MSRIKVPRETLRAVFKQTGKFVKPNAEPRLRKEFKTIKEKMMSEFNDHPVQESLTKKQALTPAPLLETAVCSDLLDLTKTMSQLK